MLTSELYRQLQSYFEKNHPFYLEILREMVGINSFTANPQGVNQLGQLTASLFSDLGFSAKTIPSTNPNYGQHLILTRTGRSGRKIGLVSHLDTVYPPEEEIRNDFIWREVGDRIYGPGTVDIKGGTVMIYMILAALQATMPQLYDDITWLVLMNASEEELTKDFGQICLQHFDENTLACLVFEGGRKVVKDWTAVVARKGRATYQITVEGKGAHAGSNHPEGANAIVQLSEVIQRVAALTDYEQHLTFNVGTITGGTVINRVPHYATAGVEMRAFSPQVFQEGVSKMLALNGYSTIQSVMGKYACQVNTELLLQTAPWARNKASDHLLTIWQKAAADLGQIVIPEERGGLSDGNLVWHGVPTLDGLGPLGSNSHCSEQSPDGSKEQEYILPASMGPKALLNTIAILKLITEDSHSSDI